MAWTAVDLFAGCGGTAEGARQAGIKVLVSANHWPVAVETHKANHPEVKHVIQDLQQANFYEWPDFDLLMASPACQGHSLARGKERPHHDVTRSTAWAVVSCAEAKRPAYIIVENVPDYCKWQLFPQWKSCLEALGYTLSQTVLNSADLGVPQSRNRLFITGVHRAVSTKPVVVPKGDHAHVPASTFLGTDGAWTPIYKPGRAEATIARIENGRIKLGDTFLAPYYGSGSGETGRSIHRPIGTVTTRDRYAYVKGDQMRMLTVPEYRAAMGFPADYQLPTVRKQAIHLLGNAVPPAMAKHVIESIYTHAS